MSNFKLIIYSQIKKHLSLFVLGLSSACFFLSNILLKDILSDIDYGLYSILFTYLSILSSFGLFGSDHVLLRTSKLEGNNLIIDYRLIYVILIILLLVSLFSSYFIYMFYDFGVSYFSLLVLSFAIILLKLLYQISRMLSMFTLSQLTLNTWKIGLSLFVFFSIYIRTDVCLQTIILYLLCFCLISLTSFFPLFSHSKFKKLDYSRNSLLKLGAGFFITMMSVSLLSFLDRFIIEHQFGLILMGEYFFYVNLYLFPFMLFSTYIGFKELIFFKKFFSIQVFKKKLIRIFSISILAGFVYFMITVVIQEIGIYDFRMSENRKLIFVLIIFGVIKITSSMLSAAMGATADVKDLKKINIFTIFLFVVLLITIPLCSSILNIVVLFIFIWVLRYSMYFILLLNQYRD